MFMTDELLQKFRETSGWEVGGDASVAVIDTGSTSKIGSQTFDQPVVAFVFGESGLMAGVSLEGSRISRLEEKRRRGSSASRTEWHPRVRDVAMDGAGERSNGKTTPMRTLAEFSPNYAPRLAGVA